MRLVVLASLIACHSGTGTNGRLLDEDCHSATIIRDQITSQLAGARRFAHQALADDRASAELHCAKMQQALVAARALVDGFNARLALAQAALGDRALWIESSLREISDFDLQYAQCVHPEGAATTSSQDAKTNAVIDSKTERSKSSLSELFDKVDKEVAASLASCQK